MPLLNVPLVRQSKYSVDCGIACVAMALHYYGIFHSYDSIKKGIGVFRFGTFMPQLGLYLLKLGFNIEIITLHPSLFSLFSKFADDGELVSHLKKIRKNLPQRHDGTGLDFFVKFIQSGGMVTPRIPMIQDIRDEIDFERPLFCSLTHQFLFRSDFKPKFSFHFNVVTGYDENKIFVNDPDWEDNFGGKCIHTVGDYLYAIYASAYGFIDGASVMKIVPK